MEEFVAYIIKNLVADPEAVQVASVAKEAGVSIEIRVAQEDVGKVIGRRGNTINALRTIVRTVATRLGQRAQVELIQEGKEEESILVEASPEEEIEEATEEEIEEAPEEEIEEAPEEEIEEAPEEEIEEVPEEEIEEVPEEEIEEVPEEEAVLA
ncbi:MAG: hypothetical protein K940chlam9_01852 [Chlamydiae bacterium]|nr:hypothetical protein [Chlamydiota bacterium]